MSVSGTDSQWRTGLVIVMDDQGNVLVDNSPSHFSGRLERQATAGDVLYMLGEARRQFEVEDIARAVIASLARQEG